MLISLDLLQQCIINNILPYEENFSKWLQTICFSFQLRQSNIDIHSLNWLTREPMRAWTVPIFLNCYSHMFWKLFNAWRKCLCQVCKPSSFFLDDCWWSFDSWRGLGFHIHATITKWYEYSKQRHSPEGVLAQHPTKDGSPNPILWLDLLLCTMQRVYGAKLFSVCAVFVWRTKCISLPACSGSCW